MSAIFPALLVAQVAGAATCPAGTPYVQGDSATFVSQVVPNSMASGKSYTVAVSFCNNGSSTWKYQAPPANGNYATSTSYFRLGSLQPVNNNSWGHNRIELSPGDSIAPGSVKTFIFSVTAPINTTGVVASNNFQWGMIRERVHWFGVSPNVRVTSMYTPIVALQNQPVATPVPVDASTFNFNSFRGADILYESYVQAGNNHRQWIPNASQMAVIATQATAMRLEYVRLPLVIPPDAASSEYVPSEWYASGTGSAANTTNVNAVINAAQTALSIANANGLKVILTLDGYTEYDTACTSLKPGTKTRFWKKSFNAIKSNAATIIKALSNSPALYAWDLMNEPLWNASAYGCLSVSPNSFDRGTQLPLLSLAQAVSASDQSFIEIIEAVHAMYNLVRTYDAYNHPTTVGEGQMPFLHYWNDVSSFASPHLYVSPQGIIDAQIQANGDAQPGLRVSQFTGAPLARNQWHVSDPLIQAQVPLIVGATLVEMNREVTTNGVALPLIIGEYGVNTPDDVSTPADQAAYYNLFLLSPLGGLQSMNTGGMFWDLSTGAPKNSNFSLLSTGGALLPAGCNIAKDFGSNPTGC